MGILKFKGKDKRLYELVAPLVMNPDVIRSNNNYPFKTEKEYIWYLLVENDKVEGFIPLKPTIKGYYIDNYYIHDDKAETTEKLLAAIIEEIGKSKEITALVKKRHVKDFSNLGFISWLEMKNYTKMDYKNLEE